MSGPLALTLDDVKLQAPVGTAGWTLVGVADFNNDGYMDLLLQHPPTRLVGTWLMAGPSSTTFLSAVVQAGGGGYPGWREIGPK